MASRDRNFAFWEVKRKGIPYICLGCGGKFLQLDHFERSRKFCSRQCMYKAQREGKFPIPDQSKRTPESKEKALENLKLGPPACKGKLNELDYLWKTCTECGQEFPAVDWDNPVPARFCSNTCRSRHRDHKIKLVI